MRGLQHGLRPSLQEPPGPVQALGWLVQVRGWLQELQRDRMRLLAPVLVERVEGEARLVVRMHLEAPHL